MQMNGKPGGASVPKSILQAIKHLQGQHDQSSHGRGRGSKGGSSHAKASDEIKGVLGNYQVNGRGEHTTWARSSYTKEEAGEALQKLGYESAPVRPGFEAFNMYKKGNVQVGISNEPHGVHKSAITVFETGKGNKAKKVGSMAADGILRNASGKELTSGEVTVQTKYGGERTEIPVKLKRTSTGKDYGPVYQKKIYDTKSYDASLKTSSGEKVTGKVNYSKATGFGEQTNWSWNSNSGKWKHRESDTFNGLIESVYMQ